MPIHDAKSERNGSSPAPAKATTSTQSSPALWALDSTYCKVKTYNPKIAAIDITTGALAPLFMAPFIAIVDGSIINSVNGDRTPILRGILNGYKTLFLSPLTFFRSTDWRYLCFLCWMVYGGTYAAGNVVTSYYEQTDRDPGLVRVAASCAVNIGLTIIKDVRMVQHFGNSKGSNGKEATGLAAKAANKVPLYSRFLFCFRDGVTMFAAFTLADKVGAFIYRTWGCGKTSIVEGKQNVQAQKQHEVTEHQQQFLTERNSRSLATIGVPTALQVFSTAIHLYALEYARMAQSGTSSIFSMAMGKEIASKYPVACGARMCRIAPAIGGGKTANNELRDAALRWADRKGIL